jgi:hypothetical protein
MPKQYVVDSNDQALDRIVTKNWVTGKTRNGLHKSINVTILLSDGSIIYEVTSDGLGVVRQRAVTKDEGVKDEG